MHKNQSGLEAILIIAIVAVVGGISLVAWSVLHSKPGSKSVTATPPSISTPSTQSPIAASDTQTPVLTAEQIASAVANAPQSPASPKLSKNSLPISEWGVNLTTTVDLGVVSYKYVSADDQVNLQSDLQKKLPATCLYAKQSGWSIHRIKTSEASSVKQENTIVSGTYTFTFTRPTSTCNEATTEMQKLEDNYKAMFQTLK